MQDNIISLVITCSLLAHFSTWAWCMQVNAALKEEMKDIHALSIKKCWTPDQQASAQKAWAYHLRPQSPGPCIDKTLRWHCAAISNYCSMLWPSLRYLLPCSSLSQNLGCATAFRVMPGVNQLLLHVKRLSVYVFLWLDAYVEISKQLDQPYLQGTCHNSLRWLSKEFKRAYIACRASKAAETRITNTTKLSKPK